MGEGGREGRGGQIGKHRTDWGSGDMFRESDVQRGEG